MKLKSLFHQFHSFMAISSVCSSPAHTQTLPTISLSSLPTIPALKTQISLQSITPNSSSSAKFGSNLVSNDALAIDAAAEAVSLASAAVEAARDAVSAAAGIGNYGFYGEIENFLTGEEKMGLEVRRKRRRKRKNGLGFIEEENQISYSEPRLLIGTRKSGHLTRRDEAELCLCLKEGAKVEEAKLRMEESQEHHPVPRKSVLCVNMKGKSLDKVLCNGRESRARIACGFRGLVASIAASYQGKGLSLQDLIQEGTIGLLKGAERFDPNRGYKLSTYVYWWIKQAIIKAMARKSRLIRLPGALCGMVAKVAEANNDLSKRLRRRPTYDEAAELLNMNISTVRLVSEKSRLPISLDKALTDEGHMTLQEIIPGPDELIPENIVERQLMKQEVEKLLKTLTNREAKILRLHYGLNGKAPQSYEEIGKLMKLSRERARQINGIALSKLKQTGIAESLKCYVV